MKEDKFEMHLRSTNLSENTITSYTFAVRQYFTKFGSVNKQNLRAYKMWLIESYKPQTVNLRIRAMNCYLDSIGKQEWGLQFVKVQQKAFLENVISEADYEYLKNCLQEDGDTFWYFVVRFMGATGVRVSELVQFKAEHVKIGYVDLYSKGGKLRRIYIPKALREEALAWLKERGQESGFLFLNRQGKKITGRPETILVAYGEGKAAEGIRLAGALRGEGKRTKLASRPMIKAEAMQAVKENHCNELRYVED